MSSIRVAAIQPRYLDLPAGCLTEKTWTETEIQQLLDDYVKDQVAVTVRLLEEAGRQQADIVTTCEDLAGLGGLVYQPENPLFSQLTALAEPYIEEMMSELAGKYHMYVLACYHKHIENKVYNVSTVFDRNGNQAGHYRKTHLPAYEKWACAEGESLDVFDLDFGKIGIAICYDMMFQEVAQVLALNGAQIIFHPTLGYSWYDSMGEATLRVRANDNSVYIVTSKNYRYNHAGKSSVIDYWGHVRSEAGFAENRLVFADIDLSESKVHPQRHMASQTAGSPDIDQVKRQERRPGLYQSITAELQQRLRLLSPEERKIFLTRMLDGEFFW